MSLAISLNNALSGLKVNQKALEVLSHNIANANTADYSREIVDQVAQVVDGTGAGVSIATVSRKVDTYLQAAMQRQTSSLGRADAMNAYASRLQTLLGKPGAADSVAASITGFFNAMQALADGPELSSYKLSAVNAGSALATRVSALVSDIQQLRVQADQDIATAVSGMNQNLKDLYTVNAAIANAHTLGRPTAGLLDKRDTLIRSISENIDVNTYFRPDGTVRLYTAAGATLIDDGYSRLQYTAATSANLFASGAPLSALSLYHVGADGVINGLATTLVTGGTSDTVTSAITTGKISAYIEMRDNKLSAVLDQLDRLAANLRDGVNAIHNQGSAYPGSATLTGTRAVTAGDYSQWTGSVRIGLVDANGQPLTSAYADEENGMRPLTIDLSTLTSKDGYGAGQPTVAAIIKEINQQYGIPQNKLSLGNLNNIQLASLSNKLPTSNFAFDFDLDNIAADGSQFFVSNVTVRDDAGADMTSMTDTIPAIALNSTGTYTTTDSSGVVTVAANNHGLVDGDVIYLPEPGATINGIPSVSLGGYFKVSNVTTNGFDITLASGAANATGSQDVASLEAHPAYQTVAAGEKKRTGAAGSFTADLTPNLSSDYYDITVDVAVVDGSGNISSSTVTYRVQNNATNLYSTRYGASSALGSGTLTLPSSNATYLTATLVDGSGKELPKVNGEYYPDQSGYLKLTTSNSAYSIVIDSLDSVENGRPNDAIPLEGSGRGFSHYFELNNFFNSNLSVATGDTVAGSAGRLSVTSRLVANSGLVSTGKIVQSAASADPGKPPNYTYERASGDNSIAHALGALANSLVNFDAAGGLSSSTQTLNGYAGEIIGFVSADANNLQSDSTSVKLILDGFKERSSSISGVNLDEELANTVIYQNAYAASARIVTVTDELFKTLLQSVAG